MGLSADTKGPLAFHEKGKSRAVCEELNRQTMIFFQTLNPGMVYENKAFVLQEL